MMCQAGEGNGRRARLTTSQAPSYFDLVTPVCQKAQESCPVFFGASARIHGSIDDRAAVQGSYNRKLEAFRRVRDDLRLRTQTLLTSRVTDQPDGSGLAELPVFATDLAPCWPWRSEDRNLALLT